MTTRTIMSARETTAWFLERLDFAPTYCLGHVPVHVVDEAHWLARHGHEMPVDVVVDEGDADSAWRSIEKFDREHGRPCSRLVILTVSEAARRR